MKRSWIGFLMLMLLLLGSVLSAQAMIRVHQPIEGNLQQAAQCAIDADWERAETFFRKAQEKWETSEHFRSCFADHNPVEEIDGDFELLEVYCTSREGISFSGGCLQLARQVAAVGEAHELVWWNLL